MEQRLLGGTGVRVSHLALGCMAFGGDADAAAAAAMFARARDAGVSLFDTADVYADGRSEQLLGRLIADAGCRDRVVLATKAYFPTGDDPNARGSSRYHLVRAVEASLRRLGTDYVDLFYLHRWDELTRPEETLRAVDDLVRAGKVLYPALSNVAAWQAAHALGLAARTGWAPAVAIQPMYNLVKRQAEVELLPMARALGLGVIPYSPLGGGLLSGKYGVGQRPDGGRLATSAMYQARYADPRHWEAADALRAVAMELDVAPATLAVAWVARHPAVTSVLLGARDVGQLEASLAAASLRLDEATYARLSALTPAPPPATDRNDEASVAAFGAR